MTRHMCFIPLFSVRIVRTVQLAYIPGFAWYIMIRYQEKVWPDETQNMFNLFFFHSLFWHIFTDNLRKRDGA